MQKLVDVFNGGGAGRRRYLVRCIIKSARACFWQEGIARALIFDIGDRAHTIVIPRILAIDFGTKRMGLAISDALGMTAQGLPTLQRTRIADDLEHLRALVEEYSVEKVLVGNPIGHSGGETSMSQLVAEFAEKLRRRLPCPVELRDERLTSVEANRTLREAGLSIGKRQRAVDRMAAVLLLQSYLDYLENEHSRESRTPE